MEFGLLCRVTLHIPHIGPNAKTIFSPLHAHVCSASLFITCFIYSQYVKAWLCDISVWVSFKRTVFSVLNSTKQLAVCFLPRGRCFCLSSRLKYCDSLKEKYVVSTCMAWAVEQVKRQGPVLHNKSQEEQNRVRVTSTRAALRYCLRWCAPSPHNSWTGFAHPCRIRS